MKEKMDLVPECEDSIPQKTLFSPNRPLSSPSSNQNINIIIIIILLEHNKMILKVSSMKINR